jgi:hypothetical protein
LGSYFTNLDDNSLETGTSRGEDIRDVSELGDIEID